MFKEHANNMVTKPLLNENEDVYWIPKDKRVRIESRILMNNSNRMSRIKMI